MAAQVDAVDMSDKPQLRTSSTDISKTSRKKYSLDGVDDADAVDDIYSQVNPPRPGFTKHDQKDMYRMGKIQEFRVSLKLFVSRDGPLGLSRKQVLTMKIAKLSPLICAEFCCGFDCGLGISVDVSDFQRTCMGMRC